ncbi:MAG: hypothetical protein ACPG19_04855 [Saprospiraceae bacterium]
MKKFNKKKLIVLSVVILLTTILITPFIQSMVDAKKTGKLTPKEFMKEVKDR